MAQANRTVEAELRLAALRAANSPKGIATLVASLLASPRIADSPEGKQFLESLKVYVRLKRQYRRWYSGDRDYYGRYHTRICSVPTKGEVDGARLTKNYWLALLCDTYGDEEAMKLQRNFGHRVNNGMSLVVTRGN